MRTVITIVTEGEKLLGLGFQFEVKVMEVMRLKVMRIQVMQFWLRLKMRSREQRLQYQMQQWQAVRLVKHLLLFVQQRMMRKLWMGSH